VDGPLAPAGAPDANAGSSQVGKLDATSQARPRAQLLSVSGELRPINADTHYGHTRRRGGSCHDADGLKAGEGRHDRCRRWGRYSRRGGDAAGRRGPEEHALPRRRRARRTVGSAKVRHGGLVRRASCVQWGKFGRARRALLSIGPYARASLLLVRVSVRDPAGNGWVSGWRSALRPRASLSSHMPHSRLLMSPYFLSPAGSAPPYTLPASAPSAFFSSSASFTSLFFVLIRSSSDRSLCFESSPNPNPINPNPNLNHSQAKPYNALAQKWTLKRTQEVGDEENEAAERITRGLRVEKPSGRNLSRLFSQGRDVGTRRAPLVVAVFRYRHYRTLRQLSLRAADLAVFLFGFRKPRISLGLLQRSGGRGGRGRQRRRPAWRRRPRTTRLPTTAWTACRRAASAPRPSRGWSTRSPRSQACGRGCNASWRTKWSMHTQPYDCARIRPTQIACRQLIRWLVNRQRRGRGPVQHYAAIKTRLDALAVEEQALRYQLTRFRDELQLSGMDAAWGAFWLCLGSRSRVSAHRRSTGGPHRTQLA